MKLLRTEPLKTSERGTSYFIETVDKKVPLPSDGFIRKVYEELAPGMPLVVDHRDDVRNSMVMTLPAALSNVSVGTFFERIGNMSGC